MCAASSLPDPSRWMALDCAAEVGRVGAWMVDTLANRLRRRGVVVGLSGGVDSSVCAALAVAALGPERVYGLLMPERASSGDSLERGGAVARQLGIAIGIAGLGAIFDHQVLRAANPLAGIASGLNAVIVVSALTAVLAAAICWPLLGQQRSG